MAMTREQITRSLGERALSYQIENQRNVSRTGFLSSLSTSYSQTKKPLLEAIEKGTKLTEKIEEEKKERKLYRDIIHTVAADIQRQKDILTQQEKKNLADELRLVIGKLFSTGKATPETVLAATMKLSEFDPVGARKILEELRVDEEFKEMAEMGVGYMETQKEQEAKEKGAVAPTRPLAPTDISSPVGGIDSSRGAPPPEYWSVDEHPLNYMSDTLTNQMDTQLIYEKYNCDNNYRQYAELMGIVPGEMNMFPYQIILHCAYLLNLASTTLIPNKQIFYNKDDVKKSIRQQLTYTKTYNKLNAIITEWGSMRISRGKKNQTEDDKFMKRFLMPGFYKMFENPTKVFKGQLTHYHSGMSILETGVLPFNDAGVGGGSPITKSKDNISTLCNIMEHIGKYIMGSSFRLGKEPNRWGTDDSDSSGTGILPKPKKLIGEVSREDFNALKNGTKKIEDVKIDYFDEATDREMNPERFPETTGGQIQVLDKQEVVDRLHKALAEIKAGNSSRVIRAYIVELADYLLRNKNITKKQYLSIVKMN